LRGPQPMRPVAAIRDRDLADRRAALWLRRGSEDRVAAARAAAAEDRGALGLHVWAPAHERDRVPPVLQLPRRRDRPAIAFTLPEPAVIEDQNGEARVGERLVIRRIELRIRESEPAGALDDERKAIRSRVGSMEEATKARALAVELDGLGLHADIMRDHAHHRSTVH